MSIDAGESVVKKFQALGTDIEIDVVVTGMDKQTKTREAFSGVEKIFKKNESIFSRFREDSELSRINKHLGESVPVSPEMKNVLILCLKFNKISGGYFDPRVIESLEKIGYNRDFRSNDLNSSGQDWPELEVIEGRLEDELVLDEDADMVKLFRRIDTTGIAKGYTVDEAADFLEKEGFENFIVDAGGDMRARGRRADEEQWEIGLEGATEDKIRFQLKNEGIATSGISRKRWQVGDKKVHHLINPKNPAEFSYDIKTVTVIDKLTVEADGRAKVLVLMGRDEGLKFANENNLKAAFLDYRGNIFLSEAMKSRVIK